MSDMTMEIMWIWSMTWGFVKKDRDGIVISCAYDRIYTHIYTYTYIYIDRYYIYIEYKYV